ncbi:hypothetical protein RchiOBHm_Chr2g0161371 [Rosa chinensis]|uniref:Uncharacterized protein n=1 Tax=Rosa chinensis TaxID=74649 RepID=A0A2P6S2S2_ROSCH|nr:hypothetical protein RchiOBHm_Chr2g0161371 [Rosa chinensis]
MPERFRYLTEEAPDPPVKLAWFLVSQGFKEPISTVWLESSTWQCYYAGKDFRFFFCV